MQLKKQSLVAFALFVIGTSTVMGGCATTGMDRSVKASNSIQDVDSEIRKMIIQINITAASLDTLVQPGQTALKKTFDTYTDELVKLDSEGKKVLKRTDELKESSKEYFDEWEKQGDAFTNPEIREISAERRSKIAEIYARVPAAGSGIKGKYHAYLKDLQEIQKYLSTDLTSKGVEAIRPVANKSTQDLDALKGSLQPLLAALDEIKAELYSKRK